MVTSHHDSIVAPAFNYSAAFIVATENVSNPRTGSGQNIIIIDQSVVSIIMACFVAYSWCSVQRAFLINCGHDSTNTGYTEMQRNKVPPEQSHTGTEQIDVNFKLTVATAAAAAHYQRLQCCRSCATVTVFDLTKVEENEKRQGIEFKKR